MKKIVGVLILLAILFLPAFSFGQIITIQIKAIVNSVMDNDNLLEGNISIGSVITGTYTYDTDMTDSNPFSWAGEYRNYDSLCGINLKSGDLSFKTDSENVNFLIGVINNYLNSPQDNYGINSYNNLALSNGVEVDSISWSLSDYSGTALSSTTIPAIAPVLSDWDQDYNTLNITGGIGGTAPCYEKTFGISANVISAVLIPEPISMILFGFGLLAFRKQ
jgi:hypothetical protein